MTEDWSAWAGLARIPGPHDKVFNQECVFSFDTAESPGGLYLCLDKFVALGQDFVQSYHERTGNALFVHVQARRVPLEAAEAGEDERVPEKVSRLAIGVPGGFNPDEKKYQVESQTRVVHWPDRVNLPLGKTSWFVVGNFQAIESDVGSIFLDSPDLPAAIKASAQAVLRAESAVRREELESAAGTWDGEKLEVSKFAHDLEQLNNGVKIPPKNWKCQRCDLTENLWLNLTDGSILCGRRFFDGSGGNNHAVEYYAEKKYPLAVKLGTITRDGQGDVYSYPEDNMVANPKLAQHMAHFGINIEQLDKTDKSMAEIEIDMNQRIGEWATLTESNSQLVPVFGPGLTGMENLGNTCYLNSLMQVLFTLPTFNQAYVEQSSAVFRRANFTDPINDFKLQMCKLGTGIWSGKYAQELSEDERKLHGEDFQLGIKPTTFNQMVGKGHPEFSGKNQQDAQEFFLHLCTMMEREHHAELNPAECLQFEVEDRIQCGSSGKV
ncbi:hypothetical protein TCAL_02494 [Tigriopus californicus]|uniref:ubiquitinyl hydrolase 1 n=1 Tax=Tigriopus californicus TaxID=6832 RepID=A0A553NTI2_TIGCA|nr:hypothetical protein TCAL_02494 [Tigriopus californicus]|eukprot:TCALIF_02494-PA protein Name:"Similar to USP5 Ubiquitin carboxyl-terminal hydrolase 5 (Homo sapiens)" AED:0.05 eAED:0.09 QI:164/0.6/0.66/1/0.8/0.83/6/1044/493